MFIEDDFIGRRFERLVVVEKVYPYISPKGYRKSRYKCICDCGNEKIVTRNALVSGTTKSCGCLNDEKRHEPSVLRKDLTGQRFGRLVVIERGPNIIVRSNEQKSTWICKCDCGNIVRVRQRNLLKGITRSCGCLIKDVQSEVHTIDLTGKKFGKLTALEIVDHVKRNGKSIAPIWRCKCDCGGYKNVMSSKLTSLEIISCGCLMSQGEHLTKIALDNNYIFYDREYSFDNLVGPGGRRLRFDFAIFDIYGDLKFLLEYQGEQHFKGNSKFGRSAREYTDEAKRKYCKDNNIILYEITYKENVEEKVKEILLKENMINSI